MVMFLSDLEPLWRLFVVGAYVRIEGQLGAHLGPVGRLSLANYRLGRWFAIYGLGAPYLIGAYI